MAIKEMFEPEKLKFVSQERFTRWLGYILVTGMMICLGISASLLLNRFTNQTARHLPWIAGLIAIEGILTQSRLRRTSDMNLPTGTYILVEWVFILIVIKILIYIFTGFTSLYSDFLLWQQNFLRNFFEPVYLLSILVAFLSWVLARFYVEDLSELEGDRILLEIKDETVISNRGEVRRRIKNRCLAVGFGIIVVTTFANLDFQFKSFSPEMFFESRQGGINLMAYFILALLLISLAHFAALRAAWAWERIPIDAHIGQRWAVNGLIMLIFVVFLAFLMPAHYSIGFFDTFAYVLFAILSIIYSVITVLILPFFAIIALIFSIFNYDTSNIMPRLPQPPPPPPAQNQAGAPDWLQVLQSVLFWTILFVVIGYAIFQFLRQNKDLFEGLSKKRGFRLILQAISWLRDRMIGFGSAVSIMVETGIQRITDWISGREAGKLWQYVNLSKMTPQQKVRFYYLALIRRSGEVGVERDPAHTPYEYSHSLVREFSEQEEEINLLTGSFVEARYSRHPISALLAEQVHSVWEVLRKTLVERKRFKKSIQNKE